MMPKILCAAAAVAGPAARVPQPATVATMAAGLLAVSWTWWARRRPVLAGRSRVASR